MNEFRIFTGNSNLQLAEKICKYLAVPLGGAKVKRFSDGEIQIEIQENVRAKDVFIIQSTCCPVNDNLVEAAHLYPAHEPQTVVDGWLAEQPNAKILFVDGYPLFPLRNAIPCSSGNVGLAGPVARWGGAARRDRHPYDKERA